MEIILIILGLLGGGFMFERSRRKKAERDAIVAETKGREEELKCQKDEVDIEIDKIDAGIQRLKDERTKRREGAVSEQERADRWNDDN